MLGDYWTSKKTEIIRDTDALNESKYPDPKELEARG